MPDSPRVYDSDDKFLGVINRLDKSNLEPGYVAEAVNRLFDRNVIKNRWGVFRPSWGGRWTVDSRNVTASSTSQTLTINSGNPIPADAQIYSDPGLSYIGLVTINSGGTGYTNGGPYNIIFSGGSPVTSAAGTFTVSGGAVSAITITNVGKGYASTPTMSFSNGGAGSGEDITITMFAHKVYGKGARVLEDNGTTVVINQTSQDWNSAADLYFFDGLDAFDDVVGMLTYREPVSGLDVLLVASNEARPDGGQGAVYIVKPGQSNRSILLGSGSDQVPMNGHDFYGKVNLVQCVDGVLMLRSGLARYYFTGDSDHVDDTDHRITLNVEPGEIKTGEKVLFVGLNEGFANIGNLVSGTIYYARRIAGGNSVELYDTRQNAEADPGVTDGRFDLAVTSGSYRYYLGIVDPKNFWTHQQEANVVNTTPNIDSPPLMMQSTIDLANPVSVGFDLVEQPSITGCDSTTSLFTCPNHRLVPGDEIVLQDINGLNGAKENDSSTDVSYFAYPVDPNTFYLYMNVDDALANTAKNDNADPDADYSKILLQPISTGTADVRKVGINGGPIPNCREAIYFNNRVIGVYGPDFAVFSDILEPTTYLPAINESRLNSGTNDQVVAIYPFNESTIIIFKQRSILALTNFTNDLSSIRLVEITRDYGCSASKSIASTGSDIFWLSQRGVVSLKQTDYGLTQSVVIPISDAITKSIEKIDWNNVSKACAAYFDNKYIISVPVNGGDGSNQMTLVYNFLNQAWDGEWSGSMLAPRFYGRIYAYGTNRLVFADESGYIHYFDPLAWKDRSYDGTETEIETEVLTRGYTCGTREHKQWTDYHLGLASWSPEYAIDAIQDDINAISELRGYTTKSRTDYYKYGLEDYDVTNANDDFNEPYREDYSVIPNFTLGNNGVTTGTKQTLIEKCRPRGHSTSFQVKVTTTKGSVDLLSSYVAAIPFRQYGSIDK